MRVLPFLALAFLTFSSFAIASSRSEKAHGAQVFSDTGCQHCHTIRGVGGHKGPDLSGVGRRKTNDEIREQIVKGSKVMPAFGDDLGPNEIRDLVEYLHSCRQKPRKAPQNSPSD
jgi:ubiquinol-cytochrome c reductase cytochrome b subunit